MTEAPKTPASRPARKRAPVKALNQSPESVRLSAQADKERKAASKAALHKSLKAAAKNADKPAKPVPVEPTPEQVAAKAAADHEAYLAALRVDAEAVWFASLTEVEQEEVNNGERDVPPEFIEKYVAEQLAPAEKPRYCDSMLVLREAAKRYVKLANGNPCNGDELATVLGGLPREHIVKILGAVLFTAGVTDSMNPYHYLNPGQQSMNLRNKARGAIKNGLITLDAIRLQIEAKQAEEGGQ